MTNKIQCKDEDAYLHVAKKEAFAGNVFSSVWQSNESSAGDRYVVSAWFDIGNFDGYRANRAAVKGFVPILIHERDTWYATSGANAWVVNALVGQEDPFRQYYRLTPKDMLRLRDYGFAGVALGAGIEKDAETKTGEKK